MNFLKLFVRALLSLAAVALLSSCASGGINLGFSLPIGRSTGVGVSVGSDGRIGTSVGVGVGGGSVSVGTSGQLLTPSRPARETKTEDR
jgi:hypothetical protein